MRKLLTHILIFIFLSASAREVINLNFDWQFQRPGEEWQHIDLPHDFQIHQPWIAPDASEKADNSDNAANVRSRLSARAFKEMGTGTYVKTLFIPDTLKGKRILLDFKGIMLVGDVFLNGDHVGKTDYGYLGFEIDVTKALKYDQNNEIKVIADTGKPNNSRWYTGGGLYRDVDMIITAPDLYFNRHPLYVRTDNIEPDKATLSIVADINAGKPNTSFIADYEIIDPDGNIIASHRKPIKINTKWRNHEYDIDTLCIKSPALWDCDAPNLYTLNIKILRSDGTTADSISHTFGIRQIEYSPDFGFKLNGKKVLLKGIANHSTMESLGAASYPSAIEQHIKLIKSFGFNHIRCSHNPYSEAFLDLCDRYGILVVDELYDKWLQQYCGGRADWASQWQSDVPEWIRRDRQHPCVVMWSLGNELQGYSNLPFNDWGVTAYKLMKTLLNKYDTSRPVTVAMHPRYRSLDTDSIPAPLALETDIAAYNYRYMYFPGDAARYPNLIFYQSEANMSNMGPNFYTPDNEKVVGLAYWGMIDYLGESHGWPAKGWTDGVFDFTLRPKANAYFLKAMFTDDPMVHIGVVKPKSHLTDWNGIEMGAEIVSENWNLEKGDTVKLYTYTNADEVELKINNKTIGRKANDKTDPKSRSRIVWDRVPYTPGTVEALAYTDGRLVATHKIETADRPVKLLPEYADTPWRADGMDLKYIWITAVDRKGRICPSADDMLNFETQGDARIIALSNSDMTSNELYSGTQHSLYQGSALVILRAGNTPSPITLTVTSSNFPPLKISLKTNCDK